MDPKVEGIIDALQELLDDKSVNKNVKEAVKRSISVLKEDGELSMKIHKVQSILEEVSNDSNMQQYTRTQLWNITSSLEMVL